MIIVVIRANLEAGKRSIRPSEDVVVRGTKKINKASGACTNQSLFTSQYFIETQDLRPGFIAQDSTNHEVSIRHLHLDLRPWRCRRRLHILTCQRPYLHRRRRWVHQLRETCKLHPPGSVRQSAPLLHGPVTCTDRIQALKPRDNEPNTIEKRAVCELGGIKACFTECFAEGCKA